MLNPPLNFPTVDDQATLDAITATVGAVLDQRITRVELTLTNFPSRVEIGQVQPTLRYWEPAVGPYPESYSGSGGYSANYLVLDVENDGPTQKVTVGIVAPTADDLKYEEARILARTSLADLTYVPASLNVMGQINGGGIQTAGSGTARWIIDGSSIRGEDGSGVDYGAGKSITAKIGADGSFFGSNLLLQSAMSGARLVLNAATPIIQIVDSNGVVRWEEGNLATNGIDGGLQGSGQRLHGGAHLRLRRADLGDAQPVRDRIRHAQRHLY